MGSLRKQGSLLVVLALPLILLGQDVEYPHGDFEDDCTLCHNANSWAPAEISSEFDHAKQGFALEGAHGTANCRGCHTTLDFGTTEEQCASCHLDPHRGELGLDCERCHTPRSFIDRSTMIRGHLATRLPLDGTHRVIDCEDCHEPLGPGNLQYVNLPADCDACHLEEYLGTGDPDHQASGFSQQCDACHTTRAWEPASFNHGQFAAGGACADCHLPDYLATTDPDHPGSGFSQQCDDCHSTNAWFPASFNHNLVPPGTECVSCHLDEYLAATNPVHQPPVFTQLCDDCHSTSGWQPASFDHDGFFPIFSGKHNGKWDSCSDCHMNPSNYSEFSCIDCHEHDNPGDLADDHSGVSGYVYESPACLNCHPTGDN